jgi:hypothetical protein
MSQLHLSSTLNAVAFYEAHGYVLIERSSVTLGDGTPLPCAKMSKSLSR